MARRKWSCYSKQIHKKPYIKKRGARGKEFIHGGADPRIRIYEMGDLKGNIEFDVKIGIQILHTCLTSDNTFEAVRTSINRAVRAKLGRGGFHLKILVHPYRIYRERKMMSFAGADRLQQGMRQSFGKPVGHCALLKAGKVLVECSTNMRTLPIIKRALKVATYKFPRTCRLVLLNAKTEEIAHQVGLPRQNDA